MSIDSLPAVIIDNGSFSIKAGFSSDNHPVAISRSLVGRPSYLNGSYGRKYYDVRIGDECYDHEDIDLDHPIVGGVIISWDNIERLWHDVYYRELRVAPEDRGLLLSISSQASFKQKSKCCQVLFDVLNVPNLCIQNQSTLAVMGSGFTSGAVVDMGFDTTIINPVYEGSMIGYAAVSTGLAASQMNEILKRRLCERYDFGPQIDKVIEDMRKKLVYVSLDASMTRNRTESERLFTLPSGETIEVGNEMFEIGELIFQPGLSSEKHLPLHEAANESILRCDSDLRGDMYKAIILCGGLSMTPGLLNRFKHEMSKTSPVDLNIVWTSESYCLSWLGGSIFAGLSDTHTMWVSKKQYDEQGEKILRKKFL